MLDDLEVEIVERYGAGRQVLEVGCGTGLLLDRVAHFARGARGIDLSAGMLAKAATRGLSVGVLTRAASMTKPRESAYSMNTSLNRGAVFSVRRRSLQNDLARP